MRRPAGIVLFVDQRYMRFGAWLASVTVTANPLNQKLIHQEAHG
jgi:hypothetical protein